MKTLTSFFQVITLYFFYLLILKKLLIPRKRHENPDTEPKVTKTEN